MKKLNTKLAIAIIFSFFVATLIPRVLVRFFNVKVPVEFVDSPVVLIGGLLSAFLALSLFALISNFIFMKRIKQLQAATERVKHGNYTHLIEDHGNDELSSLIHTFNDMQLALSSNQYLNREFIKNMSHQYKTPLTIMSSLIQGMNENEPLKQRLLEEIDQLSSLTSTLLTLSKVDSLEHLTLSASNISELIRRQIISKQPLWEVKGCEWEFEESEECIITTYEPYVYEMVSNLIDNMIHYAYQHSTLKVTTSLQDHECVLTFSNHGPQLTQDEKEHMFDLFYKGQHSSGSGVGLNLVKSILQRLNGSMSIESNEMETSFMITLPRK